MKNPKWHERISKPKHAVRVEKDIRVAMRDGTKLACDVYRPDAPGRFPALLSYSLYGKDVQKPSPVRLPLSPARGNGGQEAGNTEYFVSRGYVHVIADVRGSGDSEGEYNFQGIREQQDGFDLIEWIAEQPWCDGNVGMLGMSYFAVVQLLVAAQNPPHLRAIVPYEAYTDRYRYSVYHGGILNEGFFHQWWGHVSVGRMRPLVFSYLSEDEIRKRVDALMQTPEVEKSPYLHICLKYPEKNPLLFDFLLQPHYGPYYSERSSATMLDRIRIPAFLCARWSGWPIHLAGAFSAWEGLSGPKKMFIMETVSTDGPMRPWGDHQDLILRWYDHWLKGNDTGMMDEAPIQLLIGGTDEIRDEHEWPLARTRWTKLYLGVGGRLSEQAPSEESSSDTFSNDPFIVPNKAPPGLTYATSPFTSDTEITGPLALYLQASLDTPDATWMVRIRDEAPDGRSSIVTKGWLRASHRALDPKRSKPYQPFHPHDSSIPVQPGAIEEYAIEIREASRLFRTGHRLVLDIRGQDTQGEELMWYHLSNGVSTRHTVHHDRNHASYLLLPVIPR